MPLVYLKRMCWALLLASMLSSCSNYSSVLLSSDEYDITSFSEKEMSVYCDDLILLLPEKFSLLQITHRDSFIIGVSTLNVANPSPKYFLTEQNIELAKGSTHLSNTIIIERSIYGFFQKQDRVDNIYPYRIVDVARNAETGQLLFLQTNQFRDYTKSNPIHMMSDLDKIEIADRELLAALKKQKSAKGSIQDRDGVPDIEAYYHEPLSRLYLKVGLGVGSRRLPTADSLATSFAEHSLGSVTSKPIRLTARYHHRHTSYLGFKYINEQSRTAASGVQVTNDEGAILYSGDVALISDFTFYGIEIGVQAHIPGSAFKVNLSLTPGLIDYSTIGQRFGEDIVEQAHTWGLEYEMAAELVLSPHLALGIDVNCMLAHAPQLKTNRRPVQAQSGFNLSAITAGAYLAFSFGGEAPFYVTRAMRRHHWRLVDRMAREYSAP